MTRRNLFAAIPAFIAWLWGARAEWNPMTYNSIEATIRDHRPPRFVMWTHRTREYVEVFGPSLYDKK